MYFVRCTFLRCVVGAGAVLRRWPRAVRRTASARTPRPAASTQRTQSLQIAVSFRTLCFVFPLFLCLNLSFQPARGSLNVLLQNNADDINHFSTWFVSRRFPLDKPFLVGTASRVNQNYLRLHFVNDYDSMLM